MRDQRLLDGGRPFAHLGRLGRMIDPDGLGQSRELLGRRQPIEGGGALEASVKRSQPRVRIGGE